MKRRVYLAAAVLGSGMLLFSGCGGEGEKTNSANSTKTKGETGSESVSNSGTEAGSVSEAFDFTPNEYVKLGEYKNIKVRYPIPTVTDDDVEMEIEYLLEENTQYKEITDRGAQDGDTLNIDFTGTIDGAEFDGGSDTEYEFILGEEEFPAEFESNLEGKKAGETVTFSLVFTEDDDEELAGKTAEFTVTINSVNEVLVPEYNDEFVKSTTDFDSMADYENALKEELMQDAQAESVYAAGEEALQTVVSNAAINSYPQDLYDACYNSTMKEYQDYAEMLDMSVEELIGEDTDVEEEVTEWVNEILVAQAIAAEEGFEVKEETFETDAAEMAEEYDYDSYEEFLADYGEVYIRAELLKEKVITFLYENADVEEVSQEEYYSDGEAVESLTDLDTEAIDEEGVE